MFLWFIDAVNNYCLNEQSKHIVHFSCDTWFLYSDCVLHIFHTCKYKEQTVASDADYHGDDIPLNSHCMHSSLFSLTSLSGNKSYSCKLHLFNPNSVFEKERDDQIRAKAEATEKVRCTQQEHHIQELQMWFYVPVSVWNELLLLRKTF